jgi:hypothetical protein
MLQASSPASFWENARLLNTKEKPRREDCVSLRGGRFAHIMCTLMKWKGQKQ